MTEVEFPDIDIGNSAAKYFQALEIKPHLSHIYFQTLENNQ